MTGIAAPRPSASAAREVEEEKALREPPTGRALWPTFMRRTLDDDRVRAGRRAECEGD